jgi:DNA-binding NtrC family response regulator
MSRLRALLVDDEKDLVSALAERLGFRGIEAEFAVSGTEALEKMSRSPFDVVLLDLKLPGMSGIEVLRELRRSYPDVPVLLITGHGAPVDLPDFKPEEAFDYLAKPVDIDVLMTKMREAVGDE